MGRRIAKKTVSEESKMEIISLADTLIEKCNVLDAKNSESLAADYADDEPRKKAVQGIDDLHRGLYGKLTDRQHAQITYVLQELTKQEDMDRKNDAMKHAERVLIEEIKKTAILIRNEQLGVHAS